MWTHLARQAGGRAGGSTGGVGVRGPGETQLEVDRREINRKIAYLKDTLENVRAHRSRHRARRKQSSIPVVAIVGYTNAGKSTLLNSLLKTTGLEDGKPAIYAADQLFATLDPTTRSISLPSGREVLFSDTVGFIQKLPTELVAAFRATLEEVTEADLLLHVVDVTHPNAEEQATIVAQTLNQIDATAPMVTALNKIDALTPHPTADPSATTIEVAPSLAQRQQHYQNSIAISAKTDQGLTDLLQIIDDMLEDSLVTMRLELPYTEGQLVSLLHENAIIQTETYGPTGTYIEARVPQNLAKSLHPYQQTETEATSQENPAPTD
jgi:GTP-binding protein HflX